MSEHACVKLCRAEQADIDTILVWLEDQTFIEFLLGDSANEHSHLREKLAALFSGGASAMAGASFYLIHHADDGPVGVSIKRPTGLCGTVVVVCAGALQKTLTQ